MLDVWDDGVLPLVGVELLLLWVPDDWPEALVLVVLEGACVLLVEFDPDAVPLPELVLVGVVLVGVVFVLELPVLVLEPLLLVLVLPLLVVVVGVLLLPLWPLMMEIKDMIVSLSQPHVRPACIKNC